jgi:hypothetical protein
MGIECHHKHNDSGIDQFEMVLPEGRRCDHYSPNFCDKTTWYQSSERTTDEVMSDSGDHTTYNLGTPCYVVDVTHGKIFGEFELEDTYAPVVKVDDVTKTENPPGTTDGDYSINYTTGAVTFNSALVGTETVELSYSKVTTSLHKVQPPSGYKMRIGYIEVQMSADIGLKDTLCFQLWGVNPEDPPNLIPYSGVEKYKTMDDYIADAEGSFAVIPALTGATSGGDSWRHPTKDRHIFRFDYRDRASTDLASAYLMEIRVWLENHIQFGGEYAMGTFYGVKVAE